MNAINEVTVCVFMKPTRPGEVKTRLVPAVGPEGAAALAQSFFDDTWEAIASLEWANPVVACTEPVDFRDAREVWIQSEGDLGKRQEDVLQRALRVSPTAIVLGSDIPGLPLRFLESARAAFMKSDAVLGPSDDGGFYLIGLKRCPDGLLSGIGWSQPDTFSQTLSRLRDIGMSVTILETWFDVDTPKDLSRLQALIENGTIIAPRTAEAISRSASAHS